MILDIGLPVLNGYDVAKSIRKYPWGGLMKKVHKSRDSFCRFLLRSPCHVEGLFSLRE